MAVVGDAKIFVLEKKNTFTKWQFKQTTFIIITRLKYNQQQQKHCSILKVQYTSNMQELTL